ncbi:tape measure protein [Rhizobium pusense]|uniref:tape measure protein n=1 Tax=Agrobacterium pusense TaxID=648995 RepID=UPI0024490D82|nr:tape measure protein [Agrobacterium pusense]MDH0114025.1 tape measure protein [Agrobacterium pusense]
MIVEELIGVLGWDLKGEADLKRFKQGLADAERGMSQFVTRMATFAVAAGTAFAGGAALLGKSVISVSAQFEGYAATLETIEGSAEKAERALDWISDFAKKTPYEVAELTEAFVRLRAYGLDPTDGLMSTLGDSASAMGKTLMDSVEMIADASTFSFERLKEFGITASQAGDKVTFSWDKNGKTLTKTVKKNGEEIRKFILENMGDRFNGAMIRQSKTWNGMMSNLGDSWIDFQRRIGRGGFFDTAKSHLGDFIDYIQRLDDDGTIDRWSKSLSNGLTAGVNAAGTVLGRLRSHFDFISKWVDENSEVWAKIETGLKLIAAVKFPWLASLLVLEDILTWMEGGESVVGDFAKALSELTGVDADKIGAIMASLAGGGAAIVALGGLTPAVRGLAGAVGLFATGAAAAGTTNLLRLLGAVGVGVAGEAAVVKAGENSIMNDPEKRQRTDKGNAWIDDVRKKVRGAVYGEGEQETFDNGRFGSGVAPYIESEGIRNYIENARKMQSSQAASAVQNTVNDSRQTNISTSITQNITQASEAPAAAATATANAVNGAAQGATPPARLIGGGF